MDVKYESLEYCKDRLGGGVRRGGGREGGSGREIRRKGMEEKGRGRMREQIIKD